MKTYQSIIIGALALVFTLPTMAQTVDKEAMYIYQNDGNASIFFRNEVTSMSIETKDGELCQVVNADGREYSYPVSSISNISFVFPEDDTEKPDMPEGEDIPTFGKAIDLGLPSGTKWASFNVGASKPEEYGGYYAWGEVKEKDYYSWNTYQYRDFYPSIMPDISGTKYDVAHVKWGGRWCMPSYEQLTELWDYCYSNWNKLKWITYQGVEGGLFIGPNGNSIFLPAAGIHWEDGFSDSWCSYWSSTKTDAQIAAVAYCLLERRAIGFTEYCHRGLSVRPVVRN
ncbi:MAG: hypothetical protein IJK42_15760 [Prevotella sp.]|nr:hypothetical protein [Prevotella sp.]